MTRYVALLRAINVGGHTVKMDRLKELFADLDLASIQTYIASGNVVFETDLTTDDERGALEERIGAHLEQALGFGVETFLRRLDELRAVGESWFFGPDPDEAEETPPAGATLFIAFLRQAPDSKSIEEVLGLANDVDAFHVEGRELYWLRRGGHDDSKFSNAVLERLLGQPSTTRNVNTVRKIAAKYGN